MIRTMISGVIASLCLLLAVFRSSAADRSPSAQYVIGVSPFLDASVKDDVYRKIISFVLEEMPLDSTVALYDGYNIRTICQMHVPEARAFKSAKTRVNQFKDEMVKLRQFLAATHPRPALTNLTFDQALRLPQFLDFTAENIAQSEQPLSMLLIGSPLYLDQKEAGFSMWDGYFPSDGHLNAAREKSVFGLQDRSSGLKGVTVHLGYFGDPWVSQVHQDKVLRFWSLYLRGQGGSLGSFSGDLATAFASLSGKIAPPPARGHALDKNQTKVEMLRIARNVGERDWLTGELNPNRPLPPPSKTVGPMKIGIRWKGDLDLDLYAAPSSDGETLHFENTRSAHGYYFKDHRSSPEREYEFIEFEAPVDAWGVQARINFYEGETSPPPSGEVRIEFDGRIYTGAFSLTASHGNKGREGRAQTAYWANIDVATILKLRSAPTAAR